MTAPATMQSPATADRIASPAADDRPWTPEFQRGWDAAERRLTTPA